MKAKYKIGDMFDFYVPAGPHVALILKINENDPDGIIYTVLQNEQKTTWRESSLEFFGKKLILD
jgi:hypothetical protein